MKSFLRRSLIGLILLAIALNLTLDLVSYQQTKVNIQSGADVHRGYQIIQQIDRLSLSYSRVMSLAEKKSRSSEMRGALVEVRTELQRLSELVPADPDIRKNLSHIESLLADRPDLRGHWGEYLEGLPDIRETRQREQKLLEQKLQRDENEDEIMREDLRWGLMADTVLMLSLFFILVLEFRKRVRTEALLDKTIDEMKQAIQGLENLDAKKNELIKSTVHDLKNPLGAIKGFADLIQDEAANANSVAEMSAVIQRISEKTLTLVNSLLQPSVLQDGRSVLKTERFDPLAVLDEVVTDLSSQVKSKNQTVFWQRPSHSVQMRGDSQKIRDLFINILGNAIKFSPVGKPIFVRSAQSAGHTRIEIEDRGPGFTAEDKRKAFTRDQKLSAHPTGSETSTGLGLALAREVAKLHHGDIIIEDAIGERGARFVIDLPTPEASL